MMFERFTDKAIKSIMLAQEEARRLGHNFVDTEQLFLGLIGEGTGIAAIVLGAMNVKLEKARIEVENIIGRGTGNVGAEIPFTLRCKRVLELSLKEAGKLSICTEHLLLGLITEGEGVAVRVLETLGINLSELRNQVLIRLNYSRPDRTKDYLELIRRLLEGSPEKILDKYAQQLTPSLVEKMYEIAILKKLEGNQSDADFLQSIAKKVQEIISPHNEILEEEGVTINKGKTNPQTNRDQKNTQQQTIIVSPQGEDDYHSICEAIKNASDGSIVKVKPGTYHESLVLDKSLNIIGGGKLTDIVIESDSDCILVQTNEKILVEGLTLKCNAHEGKYAVNIPQGQLQLKNCDLTSKSEACIKIYGEQTKPEIYKCRIHHGRKSGVVFSDKSAGKLDNCDITGNDLAGIEIKENSNPFISNCKIHGLNKNGILVQEEGRGIIEKTEIFKNEINGIGITKNGNPLVRESSFIENKRGIGISNTGLGKIESCKIIQNYTVDLEIETGSQTIIKKCLLKRNEITAVWHFSPDSGWSQDSSSAGVIVEKKNNNSEEKRQKAYKKLIEELLTCKEVYHQFLIMANLDLMDMGLVKEARQIEKLFRQEGKQNSAQLLHNLSMELKSMIEQGSIQDLVQQIEQRSVILVPYGIKDNIQVYKNVSKAIYYVPINNPELANNFDNYLGFLIQIVQILHSIYTSEGQQKINNLLKSNYNKLDNNFAILWEVAIQAILKESQVEEGTKVAEMINKFSNLIENLGQDNKVNNLKISLIGYRVCLTVFTQNQFPTKRWEELNNNFTRVDCEIKRLLSKS